MLCLILLCINEDAFGSLHRSTSQFQCHELLIVILMQKHIFITRCNQSYDIIVTKINITYDYNVTDIRGGILSKNLTLL